MTLALAITHYTVAEVRAAPTLMASLVGLTHPRGLMGVNLTDGDPTDRHVWVARCGPSIAGWLLRFPQLREGEMMAYVHVYVDPGYRRRGVGSALVAAAAELTSGPWRTFGWTSEALGFYQRVRGSGVVRGRMEVLDLVETLQARRPS